MRGPFSYLNEPETTSILTPGEFVEWELDLKKGQVVIAEARSEAFDPALEIVEAEKVVVDNDDRYSGDQRPLLLWSCPKDGKYMLRVRSFRGRAGGQVFSRHVVLDARDLVLGSQKPTTPDSEWFLYRIHLKQGDYVQANVVVDGGLRVPIRSVKITPVGLPYVDLVPRLSRTVEGAICAPADGDYYLHVNGGYMRSFNSATLTISLDPIVVEPIVKIPSESTQKAGLSGVWSVTLKQGDFVELDSLEGRFGSGVSVQLAPVFAKPDPKVNPFAPKPPPNQEGYTELATRGTNRSSVGIVAMKDVTLWVATRGSGPNAPKLMAKPASSPLVANHADGRMNIGHVQWWAFDSNPGDVVKLSTTVKGFASDVAVYAPDLQVLAERQTYREADKTEVVFVAGKQGRYLVAVSCDGHGGTGTYAIDREVVPPLNFDQKAVVSGTLKPGEVKVLKITMQPGPIKLLKYKGTSSLQMSGLNPNTGQMMSFMIGGYTYYHGIFSSPTSYLIVLQGNGANYNLSFVDPP